MQKYKSIVDNWHSFREACEEPAISSVRRNDLKAGKDFEERLRDNFGEVERAEWNDSIFRLGDEKLPGKTLPHWRGEYYVQEESAAIPVEVLGMEKGDRVLDMCAAPGGKTTQMAAKIDNEGKIIANDSSGKRLKSLHANIYRTGSACVSVTNYDGRNLPEYEKFDSILVDAPCTGEGNRARRDFEPADRDEIEGLSELQKQLGEKAVRFLKEGGEMVYSTCTVNPWENERVVKYLIESTELSLELVDIETEHTRGVKSFKGESFDGGMEKTVRVYPHHLDSGVIYVAKFRK
ncbi:MAG: RsmB/NOP family class I SAM-dependent RNA methyltransferase [Candidatus Nanohaloarchaea archaeon]